MAEYITFERKWNASIVVEVMQLNAACVPDWVKWQRAVKVRQEGTTSHRAASLIWFGAASNNIAKAALIVADRFACVHVSDFVWGARGRLFLFLSWCSVNNKFGPQHLAIWLPSAWCGGASAFPRRCTIAQITPGMILERQYIKRAVSTFFFHTFD